MKGVFGSSPTVGRVNIVDKIRLARMHIRGAFRV
jgi:hypothetical protein